MKDLPSILGRIPDKELREYKIRYDCIHERFKQEFTHSKSGDFYDIYHPKRSH